jgi:hypothetical protein
MSIGSEGHIARRQEVDVDDMDLAKAIAAALNEHEEYQGSAWQGSRGARQVRVYVDQIRSRGRTRDIGYLVVTDGKVAASGMSYRKGTVRGIAEEVIEAIMSEQQADDCGAMPLSVERVVDLGDDHLQDGAPADQTQRTYALPYTTATTDEEPFWFDPEDADDDPTRIHEVS